MSAPPSRITSSTTSSLSISNYQLGEPLGKGASASVYKALNWDTGETVAVKQISLSDVVGKEELREIMSEIDLLKNLNHPNIVEYKGFLQNDENLFIILEYCENGSLQNIGKRYGKIPENLVANYIIQVLHGLIYLHSQGVIHRDIKGANILTNKDGSVKLADFGVATVMEVTAAAAAVGENGVVSGGKVKIGVGEGAVVGSPYWMAPEVIEQNGATSASDIWSLGCVVIELLEGKPPYYALDPMQALFRIVQDDGPPVPESATMVVKDFLGQCFQKDPNLRTSAQQLLKHPWMARARRQESTIAPSVTESSLNSMASQASLAEGSIRRSSIKETTVDQSTPLGQSHNRPSTNSSSIQPSGSRPNMSRSISSATPVRIKPSRKPSSGNALPQSSSSMIAGPSARTHSGMPSSLSTSTNLARRPSGIARKVTVSGDEADGEKTPMRPSVANGRQRSRKVEQETTPYDKVLQKVQEWNEQLASVSEASSSKGNGNGTRTDQPRIRRKPNTHDLVHAHLQPLREKEVQTGNGMEESSSGESLARHLAALTPSRYKRRIIGTDEQMEVLAELPGNDWDGDFAGTLDVGRLRKVTESGKEENEKMKTIMPSRSTSGSSAASSLGRRAPSASSFSISSRSIPDDDGFDDLEFGDEKSLSDKIKLLKSKRNVTGQGVFKGLYHADDVLKPAGSIGGVVAAPTAQQSSPARHPSTLDLRGRPRLTSPPSRANLTPTASSRPISRAGTDENKEMRQKELALRKYAETDEEDFDDMFQNAKQKARPSDSLRLSTIRTNRSLEDSQLLDADPFAQIEESLEETPDDHLQRERHSMLCARIDSCVDALRPDMSERDVESKSLELLSLLEDNVDLHSHFVEAHGLQAVLEILEMTSTESVTVPLLDILCIVVCESDVSLDNFCLIGGAAIVLEFCSDRHSEGARLQSLLFVHRLISYPAGLAILTSCGGLRVLVKLLREEFEDHKELVSSVIAAIHHITTVQKGSSKVDLCRSFAREGLLEVLPDVLRAISEDRSPEADELQASLAEVLLLFCQGGQTDGRLREAIGTAVLITSVLDFVIHLRGLALHVACKAIKCLCSNPSTMDTLQNCGGIGMMVKILEQHLRSNNTNEICSQVFQALYNLCRLSTTRQEEAAQEGILPLLVHVIRKGSPLKAWALPILCDLASAGRRIRKLLWDAEALPLYVELMTDPYWRLLALDAVIHWLTQEPGQVEPALLKSTFAEHAVKAFVDESGVAFENMLNPLLKLFRTSRRLSAACARPAFYRRITDALTKDSKPVIKLNLMKAIKLFGQHGFPGSDVTGIQDLRHSVERLARKNDAILVRKLADELIGMFPQKGRSGGHSRSKSVLAQSTKQEVMSGSGIGGRAGPHGPR